MTRARRETPLTAVVAAGLILGCMMGGGASAAESGPQDLKCSFGTGTSWSYDAGKFASKPASPLSFEITDVNLDAQTATLILDDAHKGALKIVRALNANSFLEVANEGFLNLTTIYDRDPATGTQPAVHSRHIGVVGQPVFAQYAGSCVEK